MASYSPIASRDEQHFDFPPNQPSGAYLHPQSQDTAYSHDYVSLLDVPQSSHAPSIRSDRRLFDDRRITLSRPSFSASDHSDDLEELKQQHAHATFSQKVKNHVKRFWWVHLIVSAVVTLTLTLLLVYVIYPNMAQSDVSKASIIVSDVVVRNPTPTSMDIDITSILLTDSPFSPQFGSFNASLYLPGQDVPFLTDLSIPPFMGSNGTVMRITQHIPILPGNIPAFSDFSEDMLKSNQSFRYFLRGEDHLKLGALPTINVKFNQSMSLHGLNNLTGMAFSNLTIDLTDKSGPPNSVAATGLISIPNPSVFTLPLGNLTQTLYVESTTSHDLINIGNSSLSNLTLTPGTHNYTIHMSTNETAFLSLLSEPRYSCGKLTVTAVEHNSTYNNQVIPYFSQAVQSRNLTMDVDLGPALRQAGLESLLGKNCTV